MAFTFAYGVNNLMWFLQNLFTITVYADNGITNQRNFYLRFTNYYVYFLLSLQPWIFSMQYLRSAVRRSFTQSCLTLRKVIWLLWGGILLYTAFMLAQYTRILILFPGYVNNDSMDEYNLWYSTTRVQIYYESTGVFFLMNVLSTCVTITALC